MIGLERMRCIKKLLKMGFITLLLLNSLYNTEIHAQKSEIYVHFAGILEQVIQNDDRMSPLAYKGKSLGGIGGFFIESKRNFHQFQTVFSTGIHNNDHSNSVLFYRFRLSNFSFVKKREKPDQKFFWGISNQNNYTYRENRGFSNFSDHYEYFTTFGPAAALKVPFSIKKHRFQWLTTGHWQVIGFLMRPSFLSSIPTGFEDPDLPFLEKLIRSFEAFHPGKAYALGFDSQFSWLLSTGNKISVIYHYDFYRLNTNQPVEMGTNGLFIQLSTRLR